jgi:hypothetical protein
VAVTLREAVREAMFLTGLLAFSLLMLPIVVLVALGPRPEE